MKPFFSILAVTVALTHAGDWPQYLGPNRDGHAASDETVSLEKLKSPAPLWRASLGGGFSSPIIHGDRVFLFDLVNNKETARALDLKTGKELWRTPFAEGFGDEWGQGPRSTPFTDGERVYGHACNGDFACFSGADGKILWNFSFSDFGAKFLGSKAREGTASRRGNNGSGLLDRDAVLVPVGGTNGASIVCLDKLSGKLLWKGGSEEAAYSSLQVADIAGARQVIGLMGDAMISLDRITGKQLWRVPLTTKAKRHAATPVIVGQNILVNSHTFGVICYEILREGSEIKARQKWSNPELKINLATPVLVGDSLYSHGPSKDFVSFKLADGKANWRAPGFGKEFSATIHANGKLLSITDEGELVIIKPSPASYQELARVQISGKNWNTPALAHGLLVVRDQREVICYAVR